MPDQHQRQAASRIFDLPRALAIEVVAGLMELVATSVSCGDGFKTEHDDNRGVWVLEDVASGDWHLEGYSKPALDFIAKRVR